MLDKCMCFRPVENYSKSKVERITVKPYILAAI